MSREGGLLTQRLQAARETVARDDELVRAVRAARGDPGLMLGTAIAQYAAAGRDKLTFIISDAVASSRDWVEQLIAESTGKQQRGIVPIAGEPQAVPQSYGHDVAIPGSESGFAALVTAQAAGDAQALAAAGRRVARTTWGSFKQWADQRREPST